MQEATDQSLSTQQTSRRTINKGLVWSAPVIAGVVAAPSAAASTVIPVPAPAPNYRVLKTTYTSTFAPRVWQSPSTFGIVIRDRITNKVAIGIPVTFSLSYLNSSESTENTRGIFKDGTTLKTSYTDNRGYTEPPMEFMYDLFPSTGQSTNWRSLAHLIATAMSIPADQDPAKPFQNEASYTVPVERPLPGTIS